MADGAKKPYPDVRDRKKRASQDQGAPPILADRETGVYVLNGSVVDRMLMCFCEESYVGPFSEETVWLEKDENRGKDEEVNSKRRSKAKNIVKLSKERQNGTKYANIADGDSIIKAWAASWSITAESVDSSVAPPRIDPAVKEPSLKEDTQERGERRQSYENIVNEMNQAELLKNDRGNSKVPDNSKKRCIKIKIRAPHCVLPFEGMQMPIAKAGTTDHEPKNRRCTRNQNHEAQLKEHIEINVMKEEPKMNNGKVKNLFLRKDGDDFPPPTAAGERPQRKRKIKRDPEFIYSWPDDIERGY